MASLALPRRARPGARPSHRECHDGRPAGPRIVRRLMVLTGVAALGLVSLIDDPRGAMAEETAHRQVVDLTFPVAGPTTYIRDYDHCRSGCDRRHRATDIMAPYGAPIHAAVGGTIGFITGLDDDPPAYGYMIRIDADDGRAYNYIHLGRNDGPASEAYVAGLQRGTRVERGQHIGFNGCSGNASCSAPHLHLEIIDPTVTDPYGSHRLDPYDSLRAAEARGDVPGGGAVPEGVDDPVERRVPRFGASDCTALVGDWDRSGRDGLGWWCAGTARLLTASGEVLTQQVGRAGDVPVVGDFNGDGIDTIAVVRDGRWHIWLRTGDAVPISFNYGRVTRGDIPIAGDWNRSGRDTVGIIRDGEWHLRNDLAGGPADIAFTYGRILRGDRPLIGDFNRDGRDTIGIVREGDWHLRNVLSGGPGQLVYRYGRVLAGDVPVMGDWNGDGRATPGIVRDETWHLRAVHAGGPADHVITFRRP